MKKIFTCEKSGFSLAEALITLLIVCLITLATIPVVTKKRRDLSDGHKGMWICTRSSNGSYVYWDKSNPVGEKDNPDTWQQTNIDGCIFTPPVRQGRFSITMIGGGGAGGDASSVYLEKASVTSNSTTSYSPDEDGHYLVELIGGGGGRGDTVGNDELNGAASAAGGSGAGIAGYFYLLKGTTYSLKGGGAGTIGSTSYHSGCNRGSNSRTPGSDGGSSYFRAESGGTDNTTNLEVGGGGGGDSTSYNADNHAVGGQPGGGAGGIISNSYLGQSKSVVAMVGRQGQAGAARNWNNPGRIPQGGSSVAPSLNINGDTPYGRGSDAQVAVYGVRNISEGTFTDKEAVPGIARVSLIERYFGLGGKASIPVSYYLPSIEGRIYVTIAPAAEHGQDGGSAVAVIKKDNVEGRSFIGYGAAAGGQSKNIDEPEQGQHSQFTMKGGGLPSPECTEPKYQGAGWGPVTIKGSKCTKVACNVSVGVNGTDTVSTGIQKLRPIYQNNISPSGARIVPTGFVELTYNGEKLYVPRGQVELISSNYTGDTTSVAIEPYHGNSVTSNMREYMKDTLGVYYYLNNIAALPTGTHNQSYYDTNFPKFNPDDAYETDQDLGEFSNYLNADEIYNNYRCFDGAGSAISYRKVCLEEEEAEKNIANGYHEATVQPAYCSAEQQGGNGTSFGAGGGGGYASLTPNVASRGGKGGPGAVIIEW